MDKHQINTRFVAVVDYLIDNKFASSKKEIADILNLKPSTLSEILNNRSNVSAESIGKLCYQYNVNIDFLFKGHGSIITGEEKNKFLGREFIENEKIKITNDQLVPLYDDVHTIGGTNYIADINANSQASELINVGDWFRGATAEIRHYGQSMSEYPSGCLIAVKEVKDKRLLVWGRNYCIETSEWRITKRLQKGDSKEMVVAYSSNYERYEDGKFVHEPITIPIDSIKRIFIVLGCVQIEDGSTVAFK